MKKTVPSKNKRTRRSRNQLNPQVNSEAIKVLRTVGDREAFYFYEAVGKPTGEVAKNLSDFLDRVKSVKSESLVFHLERRDFQNWVKQVLGDSKLAEELGNISPLNSEDIRTKIHETVENRVRELRQASAEISVEENPAVLLPYP
jgi:hypothetical protein